MLRNLLLVAALIATPVYAADNFAVKDASGTTINKSSEQQPDGSQADKNVILCAVTSSAPSYSNGTTQRCSMDTSGGIRISGGGGGGGGGDVNVLSSALPTGAATSAAQTTGNSSLSTIASQTNISKASTNVLDSPRVGAANMVITKTNMSLNQSTTICPTAAAPIATAIWFQQAGVGISLVGGNLSQAGVGVTASTQPDLEFNTAGLQWIPPVPNTNAITAYGAPGIIVCIQYLRQ